eukprot:scaffold239817_cov35-Tisochrysis_lutea.AAC.3
MARVGIGALPAQPSRTIAISLDYAWNTPAACGTHVAWNGALVGLRASLLFAGRPLHRIEAGSAARDRLAVQLRLVVLHIGERAGVARPSRGPEPREPTVLLVSEL